MKNILTKKGLSRPIKNSGFSLLEVLIAMLILAIGVMGAAVLQLATYRNLQTSHNFAYASMLAGEMADRITANQSEIATYAYTGTSPDDPDCVSNVCSAAQMAAYDVAQWHSRVTGSTPGSLPSGTGTITVASNVATILVRWDDDLSGSTNSSDCNNSNVDGTGSGSDLDCYQVSIEF